MGRVCKYADINQLFALQIAIRLCLLRPYSNKIG